MSLNIRDNHILQHIIDYCNQIEQTLNEIDYDYQKLLGSQTHKNALALCILQIGELSSVLSDDFKSAHTQMPWRDIKAMRNVVAHHYGDFNTEMLWNTVINDIPQLKNFCKKII